MGSGRFSLLPLQPQGCSVGDKSPKSKEKQKKQDKAHKDQKKTDAGAKATPDPAKPFKGGK